MVYLNKITVAPYSECQGANSSNIQSESRSFAARIRAAKAIGSQVIPEGDLSEYDWTAENLSPQERLRMIEKRAMRQERRAELEKQDAVANVPCLFEDALRSAAFREYLSDLKSNREHDFRPEPSCHTM